MKFIYPIISFSTIKHPSERTTFELGLKKGLKQKSHPTEIQIFPNSFQNCQFSVCFVAVIKCLSNLYSLSIVIPDSLTVLFSHIISSLILAHIFSNLFPEINK